MTEPYALAILGGGPAGYVAALRAGQQGLKTVLVEQGAVGGTCLHRGCIPSKALLESAEFYRRIRLYAASLGVETTTPVLRMAEVQKRKAKIVRQLFLGVQFLLKSRKVETVAGRGTLRSSREIEVVDPDGRTTILQADRILIATGSEPLRPSFAIFDGRTVMTSTEALELQEVPAAAVVIGAGAVGCEFTAFLSAAGSKVTLIEKLSQILPGEDADMALLLEKSLRARGVTVLTGRTILKTAPGADGRAQVEFDNGETIQSDIAIVAVGRTFNTIGIGLEAVGVPVEHGRIRVNPRMETGVPGIYAAGDVNGLSLFAHSAFRQGEIVVENVRGGAVEFDPLAVPRCVYTHPEAASVGLTEREARDRGVLVTIGTFPFSSSGRALIEGESLGQVKWIADRDGGRILGAAIVGPRAGELIHEAALAVSAGLTLRHLQAVLHAHPTLSETVGEAAWVAAGLPLHTL